MHYGRKMYRDGVGMGMDVIGMGWRWGRMGGMGEDEDGCDGDADKLARQE